MLCRMRTLTTVFSILLFWTPAMTCAKNEDLSSCLPKDVQLKLLVQPEAEASPTKKDSKPLNVEQKLRQLKAKCKDGKLVDQNGKEIRFVHLIGCWGNPPADYQEQLDEQEKKLVSLREKYIVIEISCAQDPDSRLKP